MEITRRPISMPDAQLMPRSGGIGFDPRIQMVEAAAARGVVPAGRRHQLDVAVRRRMAVVDGEGEGLRRPVPARARIQKPVGCGRRRRPGDADMGATTDAELAGVFLPTADHARVIGSG